jgi:hypothetical protein
MAKDPREVAMSLLRTVHSSHRAWLAGIAICAAGIACARGPTMEEEDWEVLNQGRYPVVVSSDGQWRIHVDARNVLHRTSMAGEAQQEIQLPVRPFDLAASRDGRNVALVTIDGCAGLVEFPERADTKQSVEAGAPRLTWIETQHLPDRAPCPAPSEGWAYPGFPAVAISSDGERLALSGPPVRVMDVATRKVVLTIPSSNSVLHLRFLDGRRRLLVVQAELGEGYESPDSPSDMQFAVWDLQGRELFSFLRTAPQGPLRMQDFLWTFSEATGELRTARPASRQDRYPLPTEVAAANVKRCPPSWTRSKALPSGAWFSLIADPEGRWLAGVHRPDVDAKDSELIVLDAKSGANVATWPLRVPLGSLAVAPDGRTLFGATLAAFDDQGTMHGGGEVARFALPAQAIEASAGAPSAWGAQRCTLEDEEPRARDITIDERPRPMTFEVALTDLAAERARRFPKTEAVSAMECNEPGTDGLGATRPAWGLAPDGGLWVDRLVRIEEIDPRNGKVLRAVPTPRNARVCSLAVFEKSGLVSYEGDTVTFRPFGMPGAPVTREVLLRKPGWIARGIQANGGRLLVRWADSKYAGQESKRQPQGSGVGTVYDLATRTVVREIAGSLYAGRVDLRGEEEDGGIAVDLLAEPEDVVKRRARASGLTTFAWEFSYSGSIRVSATLPGGNHTTAMWEGLRLDDRFEVVDWRFGTNRLLSLGGSMGALVRPQRLDVYDAAEKRRLAALPVLGTAAVAWHAATRQVLVEPIVSGRPGDEEDRRPVLRAYLLER